MSKHIQSFAPIEGANARILILGSMPGLASLKAHEYYGHHRNAFWPIMLALINNSTPSFGVFKLTTYVQRCQQLRESGIAVWDVLAACERPGSLDSAIVSGSEQANDIGALLQRHPELTTIVFNGKTAEKMYYRHINKKRQSSSQVTLLPKPSTSPALASLSLEQKFAAWGKGMSLPVPM
ncbi:MAG: DNA-deoxyinosine glycosylase [Granulosicoccus sp.]